MELRDQLSRSWRPFGYWALTLNASLGFPAIVAGAVLAPDAPWAVVAGVYATILAAFCTAAAVRQWGKNKGSETNNED